MRNSVQDTTAHTPIRVDWRLWLIRLLAVAGMGISAYLSWTHLADQSVACGQSQDCDIVQQSVYSEIGGVPIALLGLGAYIALFVLTVLRHRSPRDLADYVPLAIFGISLTGVLYSAYLTYLELYVIYAICKWCIGSAITITLIFLLSLPDLRVETSPS